MWTQTLRLFSVMFRKDVCIVGLLLFLILINEIIICSNQFKYILYFTRMIAHFQLVYQCDKVMDSAELINNELKYLNKWLKSNKIRINACKTKYMLFTYNINVNL